MAYTISHILVETVARKALDDIKASPERGTRNLVDMALQIAPGRFQKRFFTTAQNMLENKHSSYYKLIPYIASQIDTERIIRLGMNLGYNSCTIGAKTIREIEKRENFNIPWTVSLALSDNGFFENEKVYEDIIRQGKELGIFTWMLFCRENPEKILNLAENNNDCAFVVFCSPHCITEEFLEKCGKIYNIMPAVKYEDGVHNACEMLKAKRFLYSVFYTYSERDAESILSGKWIKDAEKLNPVITAFIPEKSCPEKISDEVYKYVWDERKKQVYNTVPWDYLNDGKFVDSIISEEACAVFFDEKGDLISNGGERDTFNVFNEPLRNILKSAFPKKTGGVQL